MRITGFDFVSYRLKLSKPFHNSKSIISERKGFHVNLTSNYLKAIGDVAPFPELGSESFATAGNILKELKTSFQYLPFDFSNLNDIEKALKEIDSFPAIKHGIEQAIISLLAKEKNITYETLLNIPAKSQVVLNSVIGLIPPKEIEHTVKRHLNSGYRTIKLKAGRKTFLEDLEAVKIARNTAGNDIKLRVDINGKWDTDEAVDNLHHLQDYNLEYAEQPVNSKEDFIDLSHLSIIPIAADESIRSVADAVEFIEKKYCQVLVLKPMMLGGILNTLKIIKEAEKRNIKVVISSSFESFVGKKAALYLAATIKNEYAHGLGTDEFFAEKEKLKIIDGTAIIDNPEYFLT